MFLLWIVSYGTGVDFFLSLPDPTASQVTLPDLQYMYVEDLLLVSLLTIYQLTEKLAALTKC